VAVQIVAETMTQPQIQPRLADGPENISHRFGNDRPESTLISLRAVLKAVLGMKFHLLIRFTQPVNYPAGRS